MSSCSLNLGMKKHLKINATVSPEPDDEEIVSYHTNLTDTSLEELLDIYPGMLYYPRSIAGKDLKTAQYLQAGGNWLILLDF